MKVTKGKVSVMLVIAKKSQNCVKAAIAIACKKLQMTTFECIVVIDD